MTKIRFVFVARYEEQYIEGINNRNAIIKRKWKELRGCPTNSNQTDTGITETCAELFRVSERTVWRIIHAKENKT